MTTIRTNTNATDLMKSVLPKAVTPLDIARRANCLVMTVHRDDFVDAATPSRIVNLANSSLPVEQATIADRGVMADASEFGRNTLEFNTDRSRFYEYADTVDYTAAFSMMAVFKPGVVNALMNVVGNESATAAERASIQINTNGTVRGRVNDRDIQSASISADNWYAAILGFNGTTGVTMQLLGDTVRTGTATSGSTWTKFYISDNESALGFRGQIDMAALFDVDLFATAQADLLADVKLMLKQFYGSAVVGVS